MRERKIGRRQFLKETGALVGGSLVAGPGFVFAQAKPGAKVNPMKLMTTTATFDPVRPESARLISQEFKKLGWDVEPLPIDYKQNVQKVIMEHEYDMWLVRFTGASLRIDPNVFIWQVHHSSQYKKGGYNSTNDAIWSSRLRKSSTKNSPKTYWSMPK
jgi:peptide/nickel transport system substrate-binding protein